jgi:hypothetical protein
MEQPKADLWQEVARMCPPKPEWCGLFPTDCPCAALKATTGHWSDAQPKGEPE